MKRSNGADSRGSPTSTLDLELFQELRESLGNELEIVAGLYRRFLAHTEKTVAELRQQPTPNRGATLHALKGSAAMVGANRIAAMATELQESLLHGPPQDAGKAIDALAGELTNFRRTLTAHLDSLGFRLTP